MAGVSVEGAVVVQAIGLCQRSIEQFNGAAQKLNRQYRDAGTRWNDSKYQQLGGIVGDCTQALQKPVSQLQDCISKLTELQRAIEAYEQVNL